MGRRKISDNHPEKKCGEEKQGEKDDYRPIPKTKRLKQGGGTEFFQCRKNVFRKNTRVLRMMRDLSCGKIAGPVKSPESCQEALRVMQNVSLIRSWHSGPPSQGTRLRAQSKHRTGISPLLSSYNTHRNRLRTKGRHPSPDSGAGWK